MDEPSSAGRDATHPGVTAITSVCTSGRQLQDHDLLLRSGHSSARLGPPHSGGRVDGVPGGHPRGTSRGDRVRVRRGLCDRRLHRRAPEYEGLRFYVTPVDRERMIQAMERAGLTDHYERLAYDRRWIYRASQGDIIVDAIWAMAN